MSHFSVEDLNAAIVIYIGFKVHTAPHLDVAALVSHFGPDKARHLQFAVDQLIQEMFAIPIDWTRHSLSSGTDYVGGVMKQRHPELSDEALAALEWEFSFSWR